MASSFCHRSSGVIVYILSAFDFGALNSWLVWNTCIAQERIDANARHDEAFATIYHIQLVAIELHATLIT